MLLPSSLSNTKKLFQRTIQSVKSLFCGGTYERLPKTPPSKPLFPDHSIENYFSQSCNRDQLDIFVKIAKPAAVKKRSSKNNTCTLSSPTPTKVFSDQCQSIQVCNEKYIVEKRKDQKKKKQKKKIIVHEQVIRGEEILKTCKGDIIREERRCLVAKKLKELENMDMIVENVLDIEEILHYYSTLTCPVYIDIFDKFFVGLYSDLFNLKAVAHAQSS